MYKSVKFMSIIFNVPSIIGPLQKKKNPRETRARVTEPRRDMADELEPVATKSVEPN